MSRQTYVNGQHVVTRELDQAKFELLQFVLWRDEPRLINAIAAFRKASDICLSLGYVKSAAMVDALRLEAVLSEDAPAPWSHIYRAVVEGVSKARDCEVQP
jgi:hypothetical protein